MENMHEQGVGGFMLIYSQLLVRIVYHPNRRFYQHAYYASFLHSDWFAMVGSLYGRFKKLVMKCRFKSLVSWCELLLPGWIR